jgi:hypothetical protein
MKKINVYNEENEKVAEAILEDENVSAWCAENWNGFRKEVSDFTLSIEEQRKAKYLEKGITVEAMTIALWESQVENRPEAVDALQAERVKIKAELPKVEKV